MTATAVQAPPRPAEPVPAEERGRTGIGEDVVAGIAARAACEVAGVAGLTGGVGRGRSRRRVRVRVRITGNGSTATLRLRLAVAYPRSAPEVSRRVRAHTARQVEYMTGMSVRRIDIEIAELVRVGRIE